MKKKKLQSIDYIKERADENLAKTKACFYTGENLRFGLLCGKKNLRKRNLPKDLK